MSGITHGGQAEQEKRVIFFERCIFSSMKVSEMVRKQVEIIALITTIRPKTPCLLYPKITNSSLFLSLTELAWSEQLECGLPQYHLFRDAFLAFPRFRLSQDSYHSIVFP